MAYGFICLHRELLEKPIWLNSTPEQKAVLVTILLLANHKAMQWEWQGEQFRVLPGQFVTSLSSLAKASGQGVSQQNVRTALQRFAKLGFLTNESTKTGRLITIVNWLSYQGRGVRANKDANRILAKVSQGAHKGVTANNNDEHDNNDMVQRVIALLNEKTGRSFSAKAVSTVRAIEALLKAGYGLADFRRVIGSGYAEWARAGGDRRRLCPTVLFGRGEFERYLRQGEVEDAERVFAAAKAEDAVAGGFYV